MGQRITVDLISEKKFGFESKGYKREEVDSFLDDICDEMERMENELQELRQRNNQAYPVQAKSAGTVSGEDEDSFREILEMAKQVKDETIRRAREDAEAIRAKADTEARERLDGLKEEQETLTREVAALKETAANYRARFEELLQAQQEALEKAADLF